MGLRGLILRAVLPRGGEERDGEKGKREEGERQNDLCPRGATNPRNAIDFFSPATQEIRLRRYVDVFRRRRVN